jgi:DNA-binding NtrC family response regulator
VTSFGGTIEVEPNLPRGTCFRVIIPAPSAPDAAAAATPKHLSPSQQALTARARVLVIEDESLLASVLRHTLALHDVTIANGCASAIGALSTGPAFDLILCDVLLGDGTAADVLAHLREHDPEALRRVVLMTGGTTTPRVARLLETVQRPVLEKPFSIAQLESVVADLLGSAR